MCIVSRDCRYLHVLSPQRKCHRHTATNSPANRFYMRYDWILALFGVVQVFADTYNYRIADTLHCVCILACISQCSTDRRWAYITLLDHSQPGFECAAYQSKSFYTNRFFESNDL